MSLKNISFAILVALLAAAISNPYLSLWHRLIELGLATFSPPIFATFIADSIEEGHRHHHLPPEKVAIPTYKQNITFQGQGYTSTAIVWNDTATSSRGRIYSGSVQVFSKNFVAKNISFMNAAPIPSPGDVGAQAVAIRIIGDQAVFLGCGFFGAQDTLHDDRGRHYFKDCYIQVDPGAKRINGAVTAHGRASKDENTGFAFVNCTLGGTGRIWLGRAWRPYSRVIFSCTTMTDIIAPDQGWNDFYDPARDQTVFFGEYNCSGAGANMSMRAPYVQKLSATQASPFLSVAFIDGDQWLQDYI
ncbi:hypothetical protein DKX38_008799 [Salix brachista]|uniref:pectinesterase n=1 Tax=Salix brachista TaxID=2182728 RepID=A0A5N5M9A0_9ROSI|nr:hypothetical protein DKX38_008799 [Salix brachista]